MIAALIALVMGYIVYDILRFLYLETKVTSVTYAIFIGILISLLFSTILVPKEHIRYSLGINTTIIKMEKLDIKSNKDIIEDLQKNIELGKDSVIIESTRIKNSSNYYVKVMYPSYVLKKIVNKNNIYLK